MDRSSYRRRLPQRDSPRSLHRSISDFGRRGSFRRTPDSATSTRTYRADVWSVTLVVPPNGIQCSSHVDNVNRPGMQAFQRGQLRGVRLLLVRAVAKVCPFMRENGSEANQAAPVERILERVAIEL